MYKLIKLNINDQVELRIQRNNSNNSYTSFPVDPANTDYQQFKRDISEGVELQDADGNVMTAEAAKEFVTSLP